MGKPKKRESRVKSDASNLSSNISLNKSRKMRRKMLLKQRRSYERLYNKLRATSSTTVDSTDKEPPPRKRKHAQTNDSPYAKRKLTEDSVIVISDETPKKCNAPVHTSTPKNGQRDLSVLNLSNVPNSSVNNNDLSKNLNVQIEDLTKEINKSSYLTIDLTTETLHTNSTCTEPTVIDLINTKETPDGECTVVVPDVTRSSSQRLKAQTLQQKIKDLVNSTESSVHEDCTIEVPDDNSSQSTLDSDVTVIKNPSKSFRKRQARENRMRVFLDDVCRMNASDKGRILDMIAETMLSSCQVQKGLDKRAARIKITQNRAVDTAEDTFIKEVILGQSTSRNSVGSNIYNPEREIKARSGLRMVVIDGSNVAMSHGQHKEFSVKGIKICVDYFVRRGHIVKAFVPQFRCKWRKSTDPRLLDHLERQGLVVYTPSREVEGRNITPYDDRYIVQCAAEFDGVIVSGDQYRDLRAENPKWREVIDTRLLQFTWVNDVIMFPKDPLGRNGPTLEEFLRHPL